MTGFCFLRLLIISFVFNSLRSVKATYSESVISNLFLLNLIRLLLLGGGPGWARCGHRGSAGPRGRQHRGATADVRGLSLPGQRHREGPGPPCSGVRRAQQLRRRGPRNDRRQAGRPQAVRVAGLLQDEPERGLQATRDEPLAAGEALLSDPPQPLPPAAP